MCCRSIDLSLKGSTLTNPAFMWRKRVETFQWGPWRVRTLWARVATASVAQSPGSEPHWVGWRKPVILVNDISLMVRTRSKILETVFLEG